MAEMTAGHVLRDARRRAGLSQTELARRAHVAQSVISAYESGRRDPALTTLRRLVASTGQRLVVSLEPSDTTVRGLPDSPLGRRVRRHRAALVATAARHDASGLRVFGSVARGEDGPESDVDLLVDLAPGTGLVGLATLQRELAEVLRADVDLVPADSLRPYVRVEVDRESIAL